MKFTRSLKSSNETTGNIGLLLFIILQRAKKVFDPSDVEVVPRKRGRPVGTGKKNRDQRNSFATTPERSKSPFNLTGSSPLNSYSHSGEFKACIICKYYTVISRGVTSKMLACSECNRNGILRNFHDHSCFLRLR